MLWDARSPHVYRQYRIVAISPSFNAPIGTYPAGPQNPAPGPYDWWSKGGGPITVDYQDTSKKFWMYVAKYRPIAIMSFSLANDNVNWNLEPVGINWGQSDWQATKVCATRKFIGYWDLQNVFKRDVFSTPFIGGARNDPSPYKGQGAIPGNGNPPDRSLPAGPLLGTRAATIPLAAIKAALTAHFPATTLNPTSVAEAGQFVSGFMCYHVVWYQSWSTTHLPPAQQCKMAGHTHVGMQISAADATQAAKIQLDTLIDSL